MNTTFERAGVILVFVLWALDLQLHVYLSAYHHYSCEFESHSWW
jgi:hypothetical protein